MPASVAARGLTGFRMANAVFGALAKIAPDRVFACEVGGDTGVSYGGYDADRRPFVFIEFLYGSWGGRPDRDGVDGCSSSVVNFSNNPIEIIEAEQPLASAHYGYVPDTGGAGKFRGGLALVREYDFEETRHVPAPHRPPPLRALRPGGRSRRDAVDEYPRPARRGRGAARPSTRLTVHKGDVLRHRLAGAGGWGDPLERDPERVLHDVREEKLTPAYAEREYGVVIDEAAGVVDEAATSALSSLEADLVAALQGEHRARLGRRRDLQRQLVQDARGSSPPARRSTRRQLALAEVDAVLEPDADVAAHHRAHRHQAIWWRPAPRTDHW